MFSWKGPVGNDHECSLALLIPGVWPFNTAVHEAPKYGTVEMKTLLRKFFLTGTSNSYLLRNELARKFHKKS